MNKDLCPICRQPAYVENLRVSTDRGVTWAEQRLYRCTRTRGGQRTCPTTKLTEGQAEEGAPPSMVFGKQRRKFASLDTDLGNDLAGELTGSATREADLAHPSPIKHAK